MIGRICLTKASAGLVLDEGRLKELMAGGGLQVGGMVPAGGSGVGVRVWVCVWGCGVAPGWTLPEGRIVWTSVVWAVGVRAALGWCVIYTIDSKLPSTLISTVCCAGARCGNAVLGRKHMPTECAGRTYWAFKFLLNPAQPALVCLCWLLCNGVRPCRMPIC
jgi:hypothetical protein